MRSLFVLACLTAAGCGGSPAPSLLVAPEGVDRWEPSGGAVQGRVLWVVNDREGWLAAYNLPIQAGENRPTQAFRLLTDKARVKFEDVAPEGEGLLLLEAFSREVWRCPRPADGCPSLELIPTPEITRVMSETLPKGRYLSVEGLATNGERLLMSSRGYAPEGQDRLLPFGLVVNDQGQASLTPGPLLHEGQAYGPSGLAATGDQLYLLWSREDETREDRGAVGGLLTVASLSEGRVGAPAICRTFEGKPEGLALDGDSLIVIFDNDKARKRPNDPRAFPISPDRDYVQVIPRSVCP